MSPIPAIILAAGASSRMGEPKQLLPYKGKNLLQHAVETAQEAQYAPVIVVLGAFYENIAPSLEGYDVEIVNNTSWKEGMGSSIRYGIQHVLEAYPQSPAVLTMLCDQPLVSPEHLKNLRIQWAQSEKTIMATQYEGVVGVPILWDQCYFFTLKALEGTIGAKKLLQSLSEQVMPLSYEQAGRDVDTPEDYQNLWL